MIYVIYTDILAGDIYCLSIGFSGFVEQTLLFISSACHWLNKNGDCTRTCVLQTRVFIHRFKTQGHL